MTGWAGLASGDGRPRDDADPELYGMVWWLAAHRARLRFATSEPSHEQIMDVIESARMRCQDGLRMGKELA